MQKISIGDNPFDYLIVDNFLDEETLKQVTSEFPSYDSEIWNCAYNNHIEKKKACNDWNKFTPNIYQLLYKMSSDKFTKEVETLFGASNLIPDHGLHGGGLHIHKRGDKLNVHLDYSTHPKLKLKRVLNAILYLTPDWDKSWGGGLQLWSHDGINNKPKELITTVENKYNRLVVFDVSGYSWHGFAEPINCPENVNRQSAAVYFLKDEKDMSDRPRALFAPSKDQENDTEVLDLIQKRGK